MRMEDVDGFGDLDKNLLGDQEEDSDESFGPVCEDVRGALNVIYNELSTGRGVKRAQETVGDHLENCPNCAAYAMELKEAREAADDMKVRQPHKKTSRH